MTIRTESRITIAGSVEAVWAYVCDVARWPEWAPTVLECWVHGGGPLQPGSRVEQRAKDLWRTHPRSQKVTDLKAPNYVAFAGTMGTSPARWAMHLEPVDDSHTDTMMWIEVDPAGIMRVAPALFKGSLQRVSNREMVAIKTAVETDTRTAARLKP
jgi:Polyketide cyclase / dehydrase and lipid transport